ncbi:tetratricopeptide repeat protein [Nostoc sp. DedSLP04]|uniref:tetratricopeptide repeat protein n=1 Tax=Nostoc sp. DedSLP04 TaxID=3075401 RepID=UPI002AD3FCBA|nr:tetratricopeptide repeat protein [Nostoc sp. DedSLP04]MDZ8034426.1 tetratricopeptide repeat protein [Nostoc sp. DedSLP04]
MIHHGKTPKFTVLALVLAIITLPLSVMAQTARIQSVAGKGKVRVQREKRTDWLPVRPATELYQGDQIFPDKGARVYLQCPGVSNPLLVRAGVVSGMGSLCINWANGESRGSQAVETLGGVDASIPYLITPRHALLLNATPLLRWNPVSGVTEYSVEVTGPKGLMWRTKTKTNQVIYAGKPLEAGIPYSVIVRTNTGKSSQEDIAPNRQQKASNLEFIILRQSEAALVKAQAAKISPTPLSNEASALSLANFYGNYVLPESVISAYKLSANTYKTYSLTSEAIALLESLIQQGKQYPLIYRTLGDLYWQTGLVRLAEANYLKALDSVQGLEDMEDWTLAQYSLGQIYAAINDPKQALEHYIQAKVGYIFLGDSGRVEVLQRRIEKLKKTAVNSANVKS